MLAASCTKLQWKCNSAFRLFQSISPLLACKSHCLVNHKKWFHSSLDCKQKLESIEDMMAYANKKLFYPPIKEENEPQITIQQLLLECKTTTNVLDLFEKMSESGQLLDEDLIFYLVKIFQILKPQLKEDISPSSENTLLINNSSFHLLLRRLLIALPYRKSTDLVGTFNILAHIGIPSTSNTVLYLTNILLMRINDFFPKDTVACLHGVKVYKLKTPSLRCLKESLLLHSENMLSDIDFFKTGFSALSLKSLLTFTKYYHRQASKRLLYELLEVCSAIVDNNLYNGKQISSLEAHKIIDLLAYGKILQCNQRLLQCAKAAITEIPDRMEEKYQKRLEIIEGKMNARNRKVEQWRNIKEKKQEAFSSN